MTSKITSLLALSLFVFLSSGLVANADVFTGDSVTVSLNFWDGTNAFEDASPNGFETVTVGGAPVTVQSVFDPTVTLSFSVVETQIAPGDCIYEVIVEGTDALGNRANPIADGTLSAAGLPFTNAFVDVGVFNGGTDGFDPITTYQLVASASGILDTAGDDTLGFGAVNPQSANPAPLTFWGGGNFGADISTLNFSSIDPTFPNGEFAGFNLAIRVVVPEPATATLGIFVLGMVGLKRRRS